jgi:hypothetical protein
MRYPSDPTDTPIRIGISACLLGEKVRFDAGHKRDAFIVETLGQFMAKGAFRSTTVKAFSPML